MKILIVQLGWSGHGVGGGDKHLLEAAGFWQEKNEITIFLPQNGQDFVEKNFGMNISGVNLWIARELISFSFLGNLGSIIFAYAQRIILGPLQILLSPRRFDVAISSSHFLYDLWPVILLKNFRKTKAVVYIYHLIGDQGRSPNFRNWLSVLGERLSLGFIGRFFDVVITDNLFVQGRLGQLGLDGRKIKVAPVGIRRPIVFEDLNKKYDFCFLGRLVKSKGVWDLVEIMKILREKLTSSRLAILGTGDESSSLRNAFDRIGLSDSVIFLGEVDEPTKYQVLQASKVFVSTSYEEGWGLALGEALSCGLPAVAYDLPVLREVFGGGPVFVPVGDKKEMADQIVKLLNDADFYDLKSKASRRCVNDYYLDLILPREQTLLES